MALIKSKGNMYPWVTHMHTHLAGACLHGCKYCYVQAMERRFGRGKYAGELRLDERELGVKYGKDRVIFVDHCNDLWAQGVPDEWVDKVLEHCRAWPDNTYVFQTKNPARFLLWTALMPPKRILGCTIESSNAEVCAAVSCAPRPWERAQAMMMPGLVHERRFITIEPVLRGDMRELAHWVRCVRPEFVNIGADSKGSGLDEPDWSDMRRLVWLLKETGIEIREKRNLERLLVVQ